jgi:hypothetical protein
MASDKNKVILRALFFSGFIGFIGYVLSQTVGLGAGGFDSAQVLTQFNFYSVGGTFLLITLLFLFGLLFWKKGNEYGDSVFYVSQGRYPSLSIFRNFSSIRLFLLSSIVFGFAGLFMVITGQKTFTGLRILEHQFTPVGSISFSALLIPISENLGAQAVIATAVVLLTIFAVKYDWSKANFRVLVLIGIPLIVATYWILNHLLRYGGSELSLTVVFIFGLIGGLITVLSGSFIPFLMLHVVNNLFFDLRTNFATELIRNYTIAILFLMIVTYTYLYHIKPQKNINNQI